MLLLLFDYYCHYYYYLTLFSCPFVTQTTSLCFTRHHISVRIRVCSSFRKNDGDYFFISLKRENEIAKKIRNRHLETLEVLCKTDMFLHI